MSLVMESQIDWDEVAAMNQACDILGIVPAPVREWVNDLDFDPDAVKYELSKLVDASQAMAEAGPVFDRVNSMDSLQGATREGLQRSVGCQRDVWQDIADFLLWLAENLVQLIDYIVDALRVIVAWIVFLTTVISLVVAAFIIVAGLVVGSAPGAIIGALMDSVILAVVGVIALIGSLVSLLLAGLNWCIEWLQGVIRNARNSICGDGLPSLPDWDPEWFPPGFPM